MLTFMHHPLESIFGGQIYLWSSSVFTSVKFIQLTQLNKYYKTKNRGTLQKKLYRPQMDSKIFWLSTNSAKKYNFVFTFNTFSFTVLPMQEQLQM